MKCPNGQELNIGDYVCIFAYPLLMTGYKRHYIGCVTDILESERVFRLDNSKKTKYQLDNKYMSLIHYGNDSMYHHYENVLFYVGTEDEVKKELIRYELNDGTRK